MQKFLSILLVFVVIGISAQQVIAPPDYIKSIQLLSSEGNQFVPIISQKGSVTLTFDDLEADEKDYYYLIEHCDKNWITSDLFPTEYISGYEKEKIYDYNNSFNTLQYYTNYKLTLPNNDTRFLISGNYRLSILNDYDEVVFTRHFIVYEPMTSVGVSIHRSRDAMFIDSQQSVQFVINHPGLTINNPHDEIFPVIYQNFDFSTRIAGLNPQFMRPDQLLYKYDVETAFWAGNEFLNFDTKELLLSNNTVAKIISGKDIYESILYVDEPKMIYTFYPDINGAFVIRNAQADDSDIEADYTWVHFTLKSEKIPGKEVYIYGGFNDFQLSEENQMTYNEPEQMYEAKILLKQGFYNYTYATVDADNILNTIEINGSFDETENDYQVLVYYSKFGSKYDRVIGFGQGNSKYLEQ